MREIHTTKAEIVDGKNNAWNNTKDDEVIFFVCARDPHAPATIRAWTRAAKAAAVNTEKVNSVVAILGNTIMWARKNFTKAPD